MAMVIDGGTRHRDGSGDRPAEAMEDEDVSTMGGWLQHAGGVPAAQPHLQEALPQSQGVHGGGQALPGSGAMHLDHGGDQMAAHTQAHARVPFHRAGACAIPLDAWVCVTRSSSFRCSQLGLLSRVCRGWREVIAESSDLWLHVSFSPHQAVVTDQVAERVLSKSRVSVMRSLDLSRCNRLSAAMLDKILTRCQCQLQLGAIDLSGCLAVNDGLLARMVDCCPGLTCLSLNGLRRITDRGVQHVVRKAPMLKMLEADDSSLSDRVQGFIAAGKFKVMILDGYV